MNESQVHCCPRFDPAAWDEQTVTWENKLFVKDRVRSFFHIPLNFAAVMKRTCNAIDAADEKADQPLVLSDENSLWGADVYVTVKGDVPGARMAHLSGTFLTKVFEGPYKDITKWINEMRAYVQSQGNEVHHLYFYYTTCPKCAKAYGRNYVVLLAKIV